MWTPARAPAAMAWLSGGGSGDDYDGGGFIARAKEQECQGRALVVAIVVGNDDVGGCCDVRVIYITSRTPGGNGMALCLWRWQLRR